MRESKYNIDMDPGVYDLGWAYSHSGVLVQCGASRVSHTITDIGQIVEAHVANIRRALGDWRDYVDTAHVEMMAVRGDAHRAQTVDVLRVQAVGFGVAGRIAQRVGVCRTALEWKGTVPKPLHHRRIVEALRGSELTTLEHALANHPRAVHGEIYDATGYMLRRVGRTRRSGAAV